MSLALLPLIMAGCATDKPSVSAEQSSWDLTERNPLTQNYPFILSTPSHNVTPLSFEQKPIYQPVSNIISSQGRATATELARFFLLFNPEADPDMIQSLSELYVTESRFEGINSDVAFVQMCLETGYLRFSGTVPSGQNNFCGLGATGNGVVGNYFPTPAEGVRAQIQHLKAYGSNEPLSNPLIDPRFHMVVRDSASSVDDLTGKWAEDRNYGAQLNSLLNRLDAYLFQNRMLEISTI